MRWSARYFIYIKPKEVANPEARLTVNKIFYGGNSMHYSKEELEYYAANDISLDVIEKEGKANEIYNLLLSEDFLTNFVLLRLRVVLFLFG